MFSKLPKIQKTITIDDNNTVDNNTINNVVNNTTENTTNNIVSNNVVEANNITIDNKDNEVLNNTAINTKKAGNASHFRLFIMPGFAFSFVHYASGSNRERIVNVDKKGTSQL